MQPYTLNDNYKQYGSKMPINVYEADPVHCAIDGPDGVNNQFTCAGNPRRRQLGLNRAFMSQRCAQNWDGYCDLYLGQEQNADFTGKARDLFIKDTLARMFCQNDTSIPGAQCVERCEQYNPTSSDSVSVCMTQGDLVFRSSEKEYAIDTAFPQTGKLQTAEPIRFTKCPKVCNIFDPKKLSDANVALNIALDNGIAMDLIQNLVENIVAARKQSMVTNSRLRDFMNKYVQDGSVKPGLYNVGFGPQRIDRPTAVPAVIPTIVPGQTYVVDESLPILGNRMISASNAKTGKKEGFDYIDLGDGEEADGQLLRAILVVSVVAIALICLSKARQ